MKLFVCVGTRLESMDRLLKVVDEALELGDLSATGLCQSGSCSYLPKHLDSRPYLPREQFLAQIQEADQVICHAGVGAIHAAISSGHQPLVMARRTRFGEVLNEHQVEIVRVLAKRDLIRPFGDADELLALLQKAPSRRPTTESRPLPDELAQALQLVPEKPTFSKTQRRLLALLAAPGPTLKSLRREHSRKERSC